MASARPCAKCGEKTFGRLCRTCYQHDVYERQAAKEDAAGIALRGGEWVPADGIMRWIPNGLAS